MREISEKLAKELLERIERLEAFCDKKAKDDTDWLFASVMAFDIRQHLSWHMNHLRNRIKNISN